MIDDAHTLAPSIDRLTRWLNTQRKRKPEADLAELIGAANVTPQQLVDLACIDLMQRRRKGSVSKVEDYTDQFPQLSEKAPLLDLIDAEICIQIELNQEPNEADYEERFPELANSIAQLMHLPQPSWSNRSEQAPEKQKLDPAQKDAGVETPDRLGGYRILRLIGNGAMGAVYEAKQISLDRIVALKTIRDRILNHPATLARFTREAYSAAQLTHHNIVQIYDFGEEKGRYFFSMERVAGGTIAELVQRKRRLDPKLAAGYTLQAARGLHFAHSHGMVHRDVKPANLLLSKTGVLKVADLGLVKLPGQVGENKEPKESTSVTSAMASGTEVTMQGTTVGTPAFMAPEQSLDAAAVDHRADLYSLGCTLFFMLSGIPPFEGTKAADVIQQHAVAKPPSLARLNRRVPDALVQIVERAMAKRPEDRYPSAVELITDLERYLGIASENGFTPSADQADQWEKIAVDYGASSLPEPLTRWTPILLLVLSITALLITLWRTPAWWLLSPGFLIAATVTTLLSDHRQGGHPLVVSVRHWAASLHWLDWSVGVITGSLLALMISLLSGWIGFATGTIAGFLAALAFHFGFVRPARVRQSKPFSVAARFIRDLRIQGADEKGIQRMVARYSGDQWQPLFKSLFSYQELIAMREQAQRDPSFPASKSATSLTDLIYKKLELKTAANRARRDQKRLFKIERRGLKCQGVSANEASQQAWQIAAAIVAEAKSPSQHDMNAGNATEEKRRRMKAMLADARSGKYRHQKVRTNPMKIACGSQTRLVAGMILLAAFAIWGKQQGVFEAIQQLDALNDFRTGQLDLQEVSSAFRDTARVKLTSQTNLYGSHPWSVGLSGLLLALSAFVSGWRMTPPAILATVLILYGPTFGIPGVGQLTPWMVSALAGIMVYVPGFVWGETAQEPY